MKSFWSKLITFSIVVGILGILPRFLSPYWLRFFTDLFMWLALALGWNIFNGYTGYIDFGYVVYLGIGAYLTSLLMTELGVPFILSVPIGGLFAAVVALFISFPTLRLRGAYFAIATLALAETIKYLVLNLDMTGGAYGLSLPPLLKPGFFYYLMLTCTLGIILLSLLIEKIKLGYNLRAIRDSEIAAESLGIGVFKNKLIAFLISAFFAGTVGGIYAYWITYVHPFNVFDAKITDQVIVMVLLGGAGTLIGPVIGATIMVIAFEIFWSRFSESLYLVFLGIMIVVIIIFIPEGVVLTWSKLLKKFKR